LRFPILLALTSFLLSGVAHAQNDKVKRGPVPSWVVESELLPVPENASGLSFFRRQDTMVHFDDKGQVHYLGYRIKLLHPNALQIGNISLAWNPSSGAPTVHAIKVHRNGEVVDVLAKSSFEILRREDKLEEAMLTGTLTAVLRVPDLRVGDELEVSQTIRVNDPTLGKNDSGVLLLFPNASPGRIRMGLSWIEGREPKTKMTPDMAAVAQRREKTVDFRFDNAVKLVPPKDAPPRYNWQRIVEYSDFADWVDVSKLFAPLYAKAARLAGASSLNREVSRIAAAHASPFDRASAALNLVQKDVRYIYIGLNGGNYTPASAEETWQRRYGDCKGKTALLLGLLRDLGIEAQPVLVNNMGGDDGLEDRLPNPQMFDHVLVRAKIAGVVYYLDGTLPPVVPPSSAPTLPYRWVLPLTSSGSSIEQIKWSPAKRPDEITLYEIDARAGFDKPARITNTTIFRGVKGLELYAGLSAATPDDLLQGLRQELIGDTWQAIDDAKWRYDNKAQASVLTIIGSGKIDWDDDGDGAKSLSLPGGGFSPPSRRIRSADQNQDLPYYNKPDSSCYVTTVRLPAETQEKHWSYNTGFDARIFGKNYYRAFELRDGSIRMVSGSRVEQQEVNAANAKADNDRIDSFDNSKANVYYEPSVRKAPTRSGTSVPATFDIDWTTTDAPCFAAIKKD
jgi:transglutaminase-like putative cysteine protease